MVQWLRLWAFTAMHLGSNPSQGTKIPHPTRQGKEKKKETLRKYRKEIKKIHLSHHYLKKKKKLHSLVLRTKKTSRDPRQGLTGMAKRWDSCQVSPVATSKFPRLGKHHRGTSRSWTCQDVIFIVGPQRKLQSHTLRHQRG